MRRKAEATTKKQAKGAMALAAKASANARRGAEKKGTRTSVNLSVGICRYVKK